jgi:predicted dehydrogenase
VTTHNETVRLASIGLGWWGNVRATGANADDSARIVSCFARTQETRGNFAEKHGCRAAGALEEIWSDPDVEGVVVATPHSVRSGVIERAAAAGKHIFVEKPLALTGTEARASAEAAEAAGVMLQVGHNKRRQIGNRLLHEMLHSGELGDLQHIEANISVPVAFNPNLPDGARTPRRFLSAA